MEVKLPNGWSDFEIIETESGEFTGGVWIEKQKDIKKFDKNGGRLKLRKITKEYLESLIGKKIKRKHSKAKKK